MSDTAGHTEQVCRSFGDEDRRLQEILQAAVRHLHAFAEEVTLTREEWMAGIRFLTAVGQRCDDARQEYILLSDTLGLSMLLELIHAPSPGVVAGGNGGVAGGTGGNGEGNRGAGGGGGGAGGDGGKETTETTVLGPFYVDESPEVEDGASIVTRDGTGGEALSVAGQVRDPSGRAVAGAVVDVWQVQPNGRYDVEDDPARPNLRARLRTGIDGRFRFETVRPVDYTIPVDGPVGRLLEVSGRHPWRPAHIHFAVTADGYHPLVTHLFDSKSPHLDGDTVFAVRRSLVRDMDGTCVADFVLQPDHPAQ